jgi:uncharacterized phage-associated protein
MKTLNNVNKLKAAILYLYTVSGDESDFSYLFMRMYFVQKEYLVRYGKPLFYDSFYAGKLGPVPLFTYNAFRCALDVFLNATDDIKCFDSGFAIDKENGYWYVYAVEDPDLNELSAEEKSTIETVMENFDKLKPFQLHEGTRDDAWKKAQERTADGPNDYYMSLVDIARAGGASKEILDYIRSNEEFEDYCRG